MLCFVTYFLCCVCLISVANAVFIISVHLGPRAFMVEVVTQSHLLVPLVCGESASVVRERSGEHFHCNVYDIFRNKERSYFDTIRIIV